MGHVAELAKTVLPKEISNISPQIKESGKATIAQSLHPLRRSCLTEYCADTVKMESIHST